MRSPLDSHPAEPKTITAAESLFQLMERSPYAIVIHRKERVDFVNAAALVVFGRKNASELLGAARQTLSEPAVSGTSGLEIIKRPDGSVIQVEVRRSYHCVEGDLTLEIFRELKDLRGVPRGEFRAKGVEVHHNTPCGYVALDKDTAILQINQTLLTWLGYQDQDLERVEFGALLSPECVRRFHSTFASLRRDEGCAPIELELVRKDRSILPVLLDPGAHFGPSREFIKVGCTIYDLADHKKLDAVLRQGDAHFNRLAEWAPVLIWECDGGGRGIYFNRTWLTFTGGVMTDAVGGGWLNFVHDEDRDRVRNGFSQAALDVNSFELDFRLRGENKQYRWMHGRCMALFRADHKLAGFLGSCVDITDRKRAEDVMRASLREKETLLQEVHHRVKNNLQLISSLFQLQARNVTDPVALAALHDSRARIHAMSLVHERMYRAQDEGSFRATLYVKELATELMRVHNPNSSSFRLILDMKEVALGYDKAVPLGLILNELLSNSFKHAFKERTQGQVSIMLTPDGNAGFIFEVRDDGCGLPPEVQPGFGRTLGLRLVQVLARQIDASLEWIQDGGFGVRLHMAGDASAHQVTTP